MKLNLFLTAVATIVVTASANAQWSLTGNAGTNPATQFIGTTDSARVIIRANNTKVMTIVKQGRVGIGTTDPTNTLDVISGNANAVVNVKSTSGNGNLILDKLASGNVSSVSYRTNGAGQWQTGTVANNNYSIRNVILNKNAIYVDVNNDYVGIGNYTGNAVPSAQFEVLSADAKINGVTVGHGSGTGANNVAVGDSALFLNTTGNANTAIGKRSLDNNTTGLSNTAIGYTALHLNNGNYNTAIGRGALYTNSSGSENTSIGYASMYTNSTGGGNTALGYGALNYNTTGGYNTGIGRGALWVNSTGVNNTGVGASALYNNNGNDNTAIGQGSLFANTSGFSNTGLGAGALYSNQSGNWNTSVGAFSLLSAVSATHNTAVGSYALNASTAGFNTAVGADALKFNTVGEGNTAIGAMTLINNTAANRNIAIGHFALYTQSWNNGGTSFNSDNVGIGFQSLAYNQPFAGPCGEFTCNWGLENTAIGNYSLLNNSNGSYNTAVGTNALIWNTTGDYNVAVGNASGLMYGLGDRYNTTSINNHGYLNGWHNQVFLGNTSSIWIGGQVTWSTYSDERIKKNIQSNVPGLEFINKLNPVTYNLDTKKQIELTGNKPTADYEHKYDIEKIKITGFLAQEVAKAAEECKYDFSGVQTPKTEKMLYTLSYEQFVVPLVKAVQELDTKNTKLENENFELRSRLEALEEKMNAVLTSKNSIQLNDAAHLEQNQPNPYNETTIIKLYVPSSANQASLAIKDFEGREIKSFNVSNKGLNEVTISAGNLKSGTYSYSLIIDGKVIDTKQMVITK